MGITQNITGRVVTDSGMRLMEGLETYNAFPLVTEAKMWISKNIEMRFSNSALVNIDYLASYNHRSQFTKNTGVEMVDGSSYNNNWIPTSAQMIAPTQCYLKNVVGWLNPHSCSSCEEVFKIIISIWKKPTTDDGTAGTIATLLFTQTFEGLAGKGNGYAMKIDGATDSRVGNNAYTVDEGEGILVSVRWDDDGRETACCNINANFEMTFETMIGVTTTKDEILLPSITVDGFNRYNETINTPNRANVIRPPKIT